MSETKTFSERITDEVSAWPGVEVDTEERGELAFKFGHREIGHLHGDHVAHFSFPRDVWTTLSEENRIGPHPVFPDRRGPAAREIHDDSDLADVIALFRLNYDRAVARNGLPAA